MDGGEDLGEADGADAVEDEIEREVDLGVLAVDLVGGDVDAAAGGDDDGDGLVDGVGDGEGVDGGGGVVGGGGDAEHVDGVDEAVDDAVLRLDAHHQLPRPGGQRVVADGVERGGGGGGGGGGMLLLAAGEVEAREAEGGDGGEGARDGEPGARLQEDVRAVHRLQGDREARHRRRPAGSGARVG